MAPKKFYGVKNGRSPGVYRTWEECKQQVDGFPGAMFKAFLSYEAAQSYVGALAAENVVPDHAAGTANSDGCDIYVDGSFNKAKGRYSWAFVVYRGGELVFTDSGIGDNQEAVSMHNVAGELAATMRAIKWAAAEDIRPITIHHDYMGIAAWATGSWQAKNKFTQAYARFVAPHLKWIKFNKVRGHTGIAGNELADRLAAEAMESYTSETGNV